MTYKEVATMVGSIGLPYAYNQFPETGTEPPFVCFLFSGSNDMMADNVNYQKIRPLSIELYTDNKDFELEESVESVLDSYGLPYTRQETYLESERMFMVIYDTDIVITSAEDDDDNQNEGEIENG